MWILPVHEHQGGAATQGFVHWCSFLSMADCLNSVAEPCMALLVQCDRSWRAAQVGCHFDDFIPFDSQLFKAAAKPIAEIFLRAMSSQRTVTNILFMYLLFLLKNCFSFRCACLEQKYYFCNYLSVFHFGWIQSLDSLSILSIATSVIYLIDRFYYYGYSNFTQQILFLRVASCSALIQPTWFVIVYWGEGGKDVPLLSLKTSLAQVRCFSHL